MKKLGAMILTAAMVVTSVVAVHAETPAYTYEVNRLKNAVTFDGKVTGDEWDDAVKLVINADNEVFQEYGRFQSGGATAAELSATYYMKWDDEYLYICEQRLDVDGLHNPTVNPEGPWNGDGTAFFFAVEGAGRTDIRWIPYTDTRDKNCAIYFQPYILGDVTDKWQCFGGKDGDVYTIEFAMPWADLGHTPAEGSLFRFCQIITSRADDADYGNWGMEDQINFYDGYNKFGLSNSEDSNYHAGMKLVASATSEATLEEAPAETTEEAAETTTAAAPAKTNPPTGVNNIEVYASVLVLIAGAGILTVSLRKRTAKNVK